MNALGKALTDFPVTTLVHVIVVIVLGIDLLINGRLSDDALLYMGAAEGGNGLLGIGRGLRQSGATTTINHAPAPVLTKLKARKIKKAK